MNDDVFDVNDVNAFISKTKFSKCYVFLEVKHDRLYNMHKFTHRLINRALQMANPVYKMRVVLMAQ